MREHTRAVLDATAFGIGCRIIEPAQARVGNRGGAHRAGFERNVEIAIADALRAQLFASDADCQHLGMGGGIVEFTRAVSGRGNERAIPQDRRADRHLTAHTRCMGLGESRIEPVAAASLLHGRPRANFPRPALAKPWSF